jgi:hypothetical protein
MHLMQAKIDADCWREEEGRRRGGEIGERGWESSMCVSVLFMFVCMYMVIRESGRKLEREGEIRRNREREGGSERDIKQ